MKTTLTKPLKKRLTYTVAIGGFTQTWHTSIRYNSTRYQPDFKKALSTMHRLKQAEDEKKHAQTWCTQIPPLLLGNGMQTGGSPILSTHLKDMDSRRDVCEAAITPLSTGQPVTSVVRYLYLRKESQQAENSAIFIVNKSVTADGSLLSPTGPGCK